MRWGLVGLVCVVGCASARAGQGSGGAVVAVPPQAAPTAPPGANSGSHDSASHPTPTPALGAIGGPRDSASHSTPAPAASASLGSRDSTSRPAQIAVHFAADSSVIQAIVAKGTDPTAAAEDLAYLSDVIGPRLTGGAGARAAVVWTKAAFKMYGADSVWTESWKFGVGWHRGPAVVEMLAPNERELYAASWGWSPGTKGPVTGNVVLMDAHSSDEFIRRFAGKLRGTWVMTRPPALVHNSDFGPMTHADSIQADSAAHATVTETERAFRRDLAALLVREQVLGVLTDAGKEFGLLNMSGSPVPPIGPGQMPNLVLPHETYGMFARLLAAHQTVTLRADIQNTFTKDTLWSENTVAEIRGSVHPDEVVLLGAHLDSWDLGSGSTDNGAGSVAVLEAARLLAAAHVRPARTIRFVLFTGEEEGLLGSEAYAKAHAGELAKYQAVMVLDNGTGRIVGMALQGRDDLHDAWGAALRQIDPVLGPFGVRSAVKGGTDHLSFLPYGVPSFVYDQTQAAYYPHMHHTQLDTYEHVLPGDVTQAAMVMAINAYQWAQADTLLPRGHVQ